MNRIATTLGVTVIGLVVTSAARAGENGIKAAVAPNAAALQLPPVSPPGEGAAAPLIIGPNNGPPAPQGPVQTKQLVIDPSQPNQLAYFSPRLGARFLVQQFYLPQFGGFWGARIVSQPEFNSPLRQLGLQEGDVVTRLDGLPAINTAELERHILQTGVRFIRTGEQTVRTGTMFIQPGQSFVDPYNPICTHPLCDNVALRP